MSEQPISFYWKINKFLVKKETNLLNDVIKGIDWKLFGKSHDGIVSSRTGFVILPEADVENFISFDEIDENVISEWMQLYIENVESDDKPQSLEEIKQQIISDIERERNLLIENVVVDWNIEL
jgi:hypothetical protein